jgi:two-component system OmpR family response regulator
MMKQRVALIEDELALAASYQDFLQRAGYDVTIYRTAESAVKGVEDCHPDLILLDIGLGHDPEAGFELCRTLRARDALVPIVFLTARDEEVDVISGLRLGADDYLTKDISRSHLLARINGLLRRVVALRNPENQEQVLKRGDLELNSERLTTTWGESQIALTYTEFWMLYVMAKNPGHIKSREQLMEAARVVLDDSTVTSHIRRIRRKFETADKQFKHLETAYGLGYRWRGDA